MTLDEKCSKCGAELEVPSLDWPDVYVQKGTNIPHTVRVCLELQLAQRDETIKGLSTATYPMDREFLGRLVRLVWVQWASEQPNPKADWLIPWEELPERFREVDRQIGERVGNVMAAFLAREEEANHA